MNQVNKILSLRDGNMYFVNNYQYQLTTFGI